MAYLGRTQLKASDIQLKAATTISGSSTNTVVLTWTAPNEQSLIFRVNGVTQNTTDFTIAGSPTTITLASGNFADGSVVEVVGINDIGTAIVPADGSVTALKLADDSVTAAKLDTTGTPTGSKFLQDDMAWSAIPASGGFDDMKVWTTSQSGYLIPSDITKVIFFVTGGGGGGAGANAALGASGGGSGGTAVKKLVLVGGTDTIDVTVGGTANGGAAGADGAIGNNSTVASDTGTSFLTITGTGGKPGKYGNVPIAPATPTNGDLNISGGAGSSGMGGASYYGQGGSGGYTAAVSLAGVAPGSGGGGGYPSSATYYPGAAGAAGVVVAYLFK